MMSATAVLILMTALFLGFGYMGVPVVFALMAGVLVASAFTPISMQSLVGQLFHGIDSETLLAVPFFLLVGELMASSDVAVRMIRLSQTLVGHLRGGLAQVVTLFSMFFAGILIFLFTLEQLICGWQNGFEGPEDRDDTREAVL